jgi:pectate lyase
LPAPAHACSTVTKWTARVVRDVRNGTGHIIDRPEEVGGWPTLPAAAPPADRDRDGIPNAWERARGLDPDRDDSGLDRDGDGYTNIEEYLAWLVADQPGRLLLPLA